jgi:hypothetical protein
MILSNLMRYPSFRFKLQYEETLSLVRFISGKSTKKARPRTATTLSRKDKYQGQNKISGA